MNSGKRKKLALVSRKKALGQVWAANRERTIYSWDFKELSYDFGLYSLVLLFVFLDLYISHVSEL